LNAVFISFSDSITAAISALFAGAAGQETAPSNRLAPHSVDHRYRLVFCRTLFAAKYFDMTRTTSLALALVTDITQALARIAGPPPPLPEAADAGFNRVPPDLAPLERFGELIAMDTPQESRGFDPPLFSGITESASLQLQASFACGTAESATDAHYREGAWHLHSRVVTPGRGVIAQGSSASPILRSDVLKNPSKPSSVVVLPEPVGTTRCNIARGCPESSTNLL